MAEELEEEQHSATRSRTLHPSIEALRFNMSSGPAEPLTAVSHCSLTAPAAHASHGRGTLYVSMGSELGLVEPRSQTVRTAAAPRWVVICSGCCSVGSAGDGALDKLRQQQVKVLLSSLTGEVGAPAY